MGHASRRIILIFVLAGVCALSTDADDLKLKDGSKVSGTIVGFDDSSFKVQTSYGFALVRKDQVASITMSDAAKLTPNKTSDAPAGGTAHGNSTQPVNAAPATDGSRKLDQASGTAANNLITKGSPAVGAPSPIATSSASSAPATAAPAPAPAAISSPPAPPTPIRENVEGNVYTNETYGFQMYKPPSWQVIAGAQSLLSGAIAAMGTLDQTTYLLIGHQSASKSVASDINATDERLHSLMANFRPQGESRVTVSGTTAVEQRFRGSVDQKDWSGTVVFLPRGGELYTIFAMTVADSDLVQIQENVIERAISSLHFGQ